MTPGPRAGWGLLLGLALAGGCDRKPIATPEPGPALEVMATVDLDGVPEPSGLALDTDGQHLWTVGDGTGSVYRLSLAGALVATLPVGAVDPEGVAVDPLDGTLFVTEEGHGEVLHLDREGNLLGRLSPAGLLAMGNSGLEGICLDPGTGHIFLLKEKDPGLLIEIDRQARVLASHELTFARDFSGLAFDPRSDQLLVISDQSSSVTWCTKTGVAIATYRTGLDKGEGIALDLNGGVIYGVSDSRATLTSFRIGSPTK